MFNRTTSIIFFAPRRKVQRIFNRRFTPINAEYAKGRIFAQSGDDDWAKGFCLNADKFLFVVVSRQTKKAILCALCASAVIHSSSALICG